MDEEYIKKYDEWNHFKKILDSINIDIPFFEREIWSIAVGVNMDIEIDGKGENFERPGIIIKKFSKKHAWIIPLSRVDKLRQGLHIKISHEELDLRSVAMITQLQRISNCRLMRKMGVLDKDQFLKIIIVIKEHLSAK